MGQIIQVECKSSSNFQLEGKLNIDIWQDATYVFGSHSCQIQDQLPD